MKARSLILAVASGVLLTTFSGAAMAGPQKTSGTPSSKQASTKPEKALRTNVMKGSIVSLDANHLVVSQKKNGKTEDMTFVVNTQTARKGDLTLGSQATVRYHSQNNENVATSIQGSQKKAQASTKNKKG